MATYFHKVASAFPLVTYPPLTVAPPFSSEKAKDERVLWIHPPAESSPLSHDVECLKYQAYLALTVPGLRMKTRTDIDAQGAMNARLPNLYAGGKLMERHEIFGWAKGVRGAALEDLEWGGYRDEKAKEESLEWVKLLEGVVHQALKASAPQPNRLLTFFSPLTFLTSPGAEGEQRPGMLPFCTFPLYAPKPVEEPPKESYADAIGRLSERLGTDKWFLGSENPTPTDALLFAYLHTLLCLPASNDQSVREEVTRRVNLVAWEWRLRGIVRAAFYAS